MKPSIAVYIQYYLTPSMTFVYRQLMIAASYFKPIVLCSDVLTNTDRFPFDKIYHMKRDFIRIKKSRFFSKIYGWDKLLSANPKLSSQQKMYFKNILIREKIRLIHAHFGPGGIEIQNIAMELNIPLIVTFHGYDASRLLRIKQYNENLKILFNYGYIIAVSESIKQKLISAGVKENSIRVIRCGIPVDKFNYVERVSLSYKFKQKKLIKFLQVSNFVEKKGHKFTILAFSNFLKYYNNSILVLGGDGPLRKSMEKLCSDLRISDKVIFMGFIDENNVRDLMCEVDVFLHHSVTSHNGDQEGIPTVIMEAMATGLPTISTFHSGIPELIDNNLDGFLINERDVESYVRIMLDLENMPDEIKLNARKKIEEKFNLISESDKLIYLYNQLLQKSSP